MAGRGGGFPGDEDDNALPWLEPAEPDDADADTAMFPYRGLVVASAVIVGVVALLWFVAERFGTDMRARETIVAVDVPLIQAPEGPYKVRPQDPGGLKVDAEIMTHAVAGGAMPGSTIAVDRVPEEPLPIAAPPRRESASLPPPPPAASSPAVPAETKRAPTPVARTPVASKPATVEPDPVPEPARASANFTVQLGAFGSAASAEQVWAKLGGRVAGLRRSVEPVETGGRTLYRLRASGTGSAADAAALCAEVAAAGEQCAPVR